MPAEKSAKKSKSNFFSKGREIARCDDLRVRIKTFCKRENLIHNKLAEKMKVTTSAMNSFMAGSVLTGSNVYTRGMIYLKTKMPLHQCSQEDRDNTINNKWEISIN